MPNPNEILKIVRDVGKDVRAAGDEINEKYKKSIAMYCERIVHNLSKTNQDVVTVDRHSHHYKLEIHRDNGGNIVSIDVIRARHNHPGIVYS